MTIKTFDQIAATAGMTIERVKALFKSLFSKEKLETEQDAEKLEKALRNIKGGK